MKTFRALVRIEFDNSGIEAETKEDFIQKLKDSFMEEFNLDLQDKEIIEIEEIK